VTVEDLGPVRFDTVMLRRFSIDGVAWVERSYTSTGQRGSPLLSPARYLLPLKDVREDLATHIQRSRLDRSPMTIAANRAAPSRYRISRPHATPSIENRRSITVSKRTGRGLRRSRSSSVAGAVTMLFAARVSAISDEQRLKRERRVAGDGEKVAGRAIVVRVAEISNMDAAAITITSASTFTKRYVRPTE